MSTFKLSSQAIRDVAEIISYLHRDVSPLKASKVEDQLLAMFLKLAAFPELGHRRPDLTDRDVTFQVSHPYAIVFRRTRQRTLILRVVHGKRDLKSLL